MAAETIKEFLVGIKYQNDTESLRNFKQTLSSLTRDIAAVGIGAGSGLTGFIYSLNKTADALANVYYQAQLAATSGGKLMQLKFAGDQVNKLGDSLVKMATTIRTHMLDTNGAYAAYFGAMGIGASNASDSVDLLYNTVKKYHEIIKNNGTQVQIRSILSQMGMDPNAIMLLAKNWDAFVDSYKQFKDITKDAGFSNIDEALKNSVEYQRQWNVLWNTFFLGWEKFSTDLMPTITRIFVDLENLLKTHQPEIEGFFKSFESYLGDLNKPAAWKEFEGHILNISTGISNAVGEVEKLVGSFRTALPIIGTVAGMLYGGPAGALIGLALGSALSGLGTDPGKPLTGPPLPSFSEKTIENLLKKEDGSNTQGQLSKAWGWLKGMFTPSGGMFTAPNGAAPGFTPSAYRTDENANGGVAISSSTGVGERLHSWLIGMTSYIPWVKIVQDDKDGGTISTAMRTMQSMRAGAGSPEYNPTNDPQKLQKMQDAIGFFVSKGLSQEQATGLVARLARESGGGWLNPNAVNPVSGAYGIAQWLGSRKSEALGTGGDLNKQLELVWKELTTTESQALREILSTNSSEAAAMAAERFERAGDPAFSRSAANLARHMSRALGDFTNQNLYNGKMQGVGDPRFIQASLMNPTPASLSPLSASGGTNINVSPTTTIHVHGGGPEIGSYVFGTQKRLNGDLVRNLQTALV